MRRFIPLVCAVMFAIAATAQDQRGFSSSLSFSERHDHSNGYVTDVGTSLRYDFGKHFGVEAGIPLEFVRDASLTYTTPTGSTATRNSNFEGVGNAYLALQWKVGSSLLHWAPTVTATAPTGDRTHGLSTGRPTIDLNNRLESSLGLVTPFLEAGLGNSTPNVRLASWMNSHGFDQPFSSLGAMSHFRAGFALPIFSDKVGFEAGAWDLSPFGDQKLYSKVVSSASAALTAAQQAAANKRQRWYELASVIAGNSSIAADHGFLGSFDISPNPHVELEVAYNRSIRFALDSVSATIAFHFGHIAQSSK